MRRLLVAAVLLGAAWLGLAYLGQLGVGPVVITREDEQKLILLFGQPRRVSPWSEDRVTKPGWTLRIPIALLEEVRSYPRRLLYFNADSKEIQTKDEERIVVDNYIVWQVADAIQFLRSYPQGMSQAEAQIDRVIRADVREVIGRHTLTEVLTTRRGEINREITERSARDLEQDGIDVAEVRINRTELPRAAGSNVFERMKTERERLARKYRAEGEEEARRIRAEAEREATVIVALAGRDAEIARGEGDATATRIYAEAYRSDLDFYEFRRSLEAYRKTLGQDTTLVLSPDAEFFQFLGRTTPAARDDGP